MRSVRRAKLEKRFVCCWSYFITTSAKEDTFSSLFVSLSVCLPVCFERICMKFSEKVGNGPMNKWLNFDGDPDQRSGSGIRIRIEIPVRRALAEVCTVPVLLVVRFVWVPVHLNYYMSTFNQFFGLRRAKMANACKGRCTLPRLPRPHPFVDFWAVTQQTATFWGVGTPKLELGRDLCTMHLIAKFHRRTLNRLEVIVLTNKLANKQTPLTISTSLRYATPVGNNYTRYIKVLRYCVISRTVWMQWML